MTSEHKNLVSKKLIKRVFINDLKDLNSAINTVVHFYESEPVLMKCLVDFTRSTTRHMASDYPGVKYTSPRIFQDIQNLCQHFFLKGFIIGQESVRNQLDGALEDLIDIKSLTDPESGKNPFDNTIDLPEEDPGSFF